MALQFFYVFKKLITTIIQHSITKNIRKLQKKHNKSQNSNQRDDIFLSVPLGALTENRRVYGGGARERDQS